MKRLTPLFLGLTLTILASPLLAQTATPQSAPTGTAVTVSPTYGTPVTLAHAQDLIARAVEASRAGGFRMAIAIVEPSGQLVAFARMDDTQYGSIAVAQKKAATAARFRSATSGMQARVEAGRLTILGMDDILAVAGGVPIIVDGRVVGAIGISGATSSEDDAIARAALGQP